MNSKEPNQYDSLLENLEVGADTYKFYDLNRLNDKRYGEYFDS